MSGDAAIKQFEVALQPRKQELIRLVAVFQQADPNCQVSATVAQID